MSIFALSLSDYLYAQARNIALEDHASLNQFITVAVAEKVAAMQTTEFFAQRASTAQPEDLAVCLRQVSNRPPVAGDERDWNPDRPQQIRRPPSALTNRDLSPIPTPIPQG